ncbi:MAG TPA: hypothetical protein VFX02_02030, partial [Gammaproteobacteria bacterium]|nr:hypothetical protein [Gammaproteobacteria bacterium]
MKGTESRKNYTLVATSLSRQGLNPLLIHLINKKAGARPAFLLFGGERGIIKYVPVFCPAGLAACTASSKSLSLGRALVKPVPCMQGGSNINGSRNRLFILLRGRDYSAHPCASPFRLATLVQNCSRQFCRTGPLNRGFKPAFIGKNKKDPQGVLFICTGGEGGIRT